MATLPAPFSSIPSYSLLYPDYNLQIQPLRRLTTHLASTKSSQSPTPTIYICREDTNSGLAFGGNKIRKLEYVVPDIVSSPGASSEKPVTTIVTTGGIQSNHQRAVAAVAALLGLKCVLVPRDAVASENQPDVEVYHASGNVQLTQLLGAEVRQAGASESDAVIAELQAKGEVPYWIPSGSSLHPKGGLGYARWAFELDAWEAQSGVHFNTIVVACASGSTLGGMVAGFKYLEKTSVESGFACPRKRKRVIGIDAWAAADEKAWREMVLGIARRTAVLIGLQEGDVTEQDVRLERRWNGGAYGRCDDVTKEAMRTLARLEGVLTDPVYTGKAAAGLMGIVKAGGFSEGENVLFVHTGGQAALSAYPGIF